MVIKERQTQKLDAFDKTSEIERVRHNVSTILSHHVLLSFNNNLNDIDNNPVIVLREVLAGILGAKEVQIQALGIDVEEPGSENDAITLREAKNIIVKDVMETIRNIVSKKKDKKQLNEQEMRIVNDFETANNLDDKRSFFARLKTAIENHLEIDSHTDISDRKTASDPQLPFSNLVSKQAVWANAKNPLVQRQVLLLREAKVARDRIAARCGLDIPTVAKIEKTLMLQNGKTVPRPKE